MGLAVNGRGSMLFMTQSAVGDESPMIEAYEGVRISFGFRFLY
jgi:hypothetical protein